MSSIVKMSRKWIQDTLGSGGHLTGGLPDKGIRDSFMKICRAIKTGGGTMATQD